AQQRVAEIQQAKEAARVLQAFARTSCKDKSPEECLALFEKEREKGRHLLHTLASFFSVYGVPNDLATLLTGEDLNGEEGSRLWAFIGVITGGYGSKVKKGANVIDETLDVVKKGSQSVEKNAAKQASRIDDAPNVAGDVPYNPRDIRNTLEDRYGADNVVSTTVPPSNAPNVKLAGQSHPETGIVFDNRGFPIFDDVAVFDTRLPIDDFRGASYTDQMKMATRELNEAIKNGQIPTDSFTPVQLREIEKESSTIPGYTWHHHQDTGRMQLVPRDVHQATGHSGWESMHKGQ
ncbi:MAG: HNH endonuclease, partial [Candidatus Hadarchaeum sp.]